MTIIKNLFNKKYFVKDFLKSYCILCIALFFKTGVPNISINNIFINLVFIVCFFNLIKILINLIFSLKGSDLRNLNILFFSSLFVSLIRTSSLYFARIIQSKPGLIWNVDLGFSLSHSQNVLKYGNLENSLTLSGFSETYHIGPSYISAILSSFFKSSIELFTLLILPIIFFSAFIFATRLIINHLVRDEKYELILSSIICFIPGLFLGDPNLSTIFNGDLLTKSFAYNLPYQFSTMQNSMMAGSAILCIFYFLITSIKENIYLIFSTSLSLYAIKPLYFVSAFLFITLFLTLLFIYKNNLVLRKHYIELKKIFNFKTIFLLIIIFSIWFFFYKFYLRPFYDASFSLSFFKDILNLFNNFSLDNLKYLLKVPYRSIIDLPLISSSIFLILLIIKFSKGIKLNFREVFFINYSIILYLISILVSFLSVVISLSYKISNVEAIAFGEKIGIYPNIYGEYLINETQASFPLFTLVTILGASCIASSLKINSKMQSSLFINFNKIFLSIIILFNTFHTNLLIFKNNYVNNYFSSKRDEVDASDYYKLIKEIPIENSLLLSNSVEAGYYGRAFRNTYLTAFTTHDHFLANIRDYHWRNNSDETLRRLKIYYQIFPRKNDFLGTYNPKSIEIIRDNKISHLILKKVNSKKVNIEFRGLKFLKENDNWILYNVINQK